MSDTEASKKKRGSHPRLSRLTLVVCLLSVVFTCTAIFISDGMGDTAQSIYEHPYTVSNNARAMRSRLLDMKRFVSTFLIHGTSSEETAAALFEERYALQNEAMDILDQRYDGPAEDLTALRAAFSELIRSHNGAIDFALAHTDAEVERYLDDHVYPKYDAVEACLLVIIDHADGEILSLTQQARRASLVFTVVAVFLCVVIILLSVFSSRMERKSIEALRAREHDLEDALLMAQQAGNAKKDFLSRMSHEIRTPMNVIIGMTAIAGAHVQEPERLEDCLSKIAYSSRHLLSLINDVLDMSKIEEGKLNINHEVFELRQLVESSIAIIQPQTRDQGKRFRCDVKGAVLESYVGDYLRVNQILLNILSNAVKFTPEGGLILMTVEQVSVKDGRAWLRFVISDTGIGMNEEFLARIFHPFEQAGDATSQYGGTGLGMAITYNLVELLGGSIHVRSKVGEGSTFTVDLPFDLPEELMKPREWTLDALNVLVVDDDADACAHASLLLERMGIQANWVQSGLEAIQLVFDAHDGHEDYDVCLIDWKMPEMDGVETTRRIRERLGPETIIIIISAYDWSTIEVEARKAGANAFISKPLFESSLYNVLQSIFGTQAVKTEARKTRTGAYKGKRFLLAEDNILNREIAVELLRETGAELECAANGKETVDKFLAAPQGYYDAIFMDIQMPVMDGYEATKYIRVSGHPDATTVPIFAMTANAFREDVEKCLNAGMNDHIAKPIEVDRLYNLLDNV